MQSTMVSYVDSLVQCDVPPTRATVTTIFWMQTVFWEWKRERECAYVRAKVRLEKFAKEEGREHEARLALLKVIPVKDKVR